jgi:hypothetical protein
MLRYVDVRMGALVVIAGVGLFLASNDVKDFSMGSVDAAFMPRIAAVLFILLGSVLLIRGWRQWQAAEQVPAVDPEPRLDEHGGWGGWSAVLCSALLMLGYVGLLEYLGFILASSAYVFLQIQILRKTAPPRHLLFALVAVTVPTGAYLLFVHAFQVMVPAGVLG